MRAYRHRVMRRQRLTANGSSKRQRKGVAFKQQRHSSLYNDDSNCKMPVYLSSRTNLIITMTTFFLFRHSQTQTRVGDESTKLKREILFMRSPVVVICSIVYRIGDETWATHSISMFVRLCVFVVVFRWHNNILWWFWMKLVLFRIDADISSVHTFHSLDFCWHIGIQQNSQSSNGILLRAWQ